MGPPFRVRDGYYQDYPPQQVYPPGPGPPYPPVGMTQPNMPHDPLQGMAPQYGPGPQGSQSHVQSPQLKPESVGTGHATLPTNLSPLHPQVYLQQGYPGYPQQGYYPPQYPQQGYYPQDRPPQPYYPDYQPGYPQNPGYQGYPPQGGFFQQGYQPGQVAPGQAGSLANTAFCASCIACITCLLCSCCQGLLGVAPGDEQLPGDDYGPSQPVDVAPPAGLGPPTTTAPAIPSPPAAHI